MGKYVIEPGESFQYTAYGHKGVTHRRLIGEENVGAKHMEVLVATIEAGGGAENHSHEVEQAVYMIEGKAYVDVDGEREEMKAGDMVFFPPGKVHRITTAGGPYKSLAIFAPQRTQAK